MLARDIYPLLPELVAEQMPPLPSLEPEQEVETGLVSKAETEESST